jgi:putative DNA primase/helicase
VGDSNGAIPAHGQLASEVTERDVDWIFEDVLARGQIQEDIGDPGLGKSTVTIELAASVTTGRNFAGFPCLASGPVALLSAEDGAAETIVPRLRAAQARLELVRIVPAALGSAGRIQPVNLPAHISLLEDIIGADGTVLLVIDPVTAFLSDKTDAHNDASVRRVLAELLALAQRTNCAILLVRHLNKMGGVDKAMYRGGGSIAFSAAARLSFLIGLDPNDKASQNERRRIFAGVKNNLGPMIQSRAFRLRAEPGERAHVEWIAEPSLLTADDLLRMPREHKAAALEEAVNFLESELREGAKLSVDIERHARELKISDRTLARARKIAGVRPQNKGFAGDWFLEIPNEITVEKDAEQ